VAEHRARALTPDRPIIRGTAQNPDTFFQAREACNPFYDDCPGIVEDAMQQFAERTGRRYGLFEYVGHREAQRVIIVMGVRHRLRRAGPRHVAAPQGEHPGP
jgi:pyruvate-ferredoxin/flavodoxin oxidoreductase